MLEITKEYTVGQKVCALSLITMARTIAKILYEAKVLAGGSTRPS